MVRRRALGSDTSRDVHIKGKERVTSNKYTWFKKFVTVSAVIGVLLFGYFYFVPTEISSLAYFSINYERVRKTIKCSDNFKEDLVKFPSCAPKSCARVVMDDVVDVEDAHHLLRIAKTGLELGGSNGGASILDLHSGALSKEDRFVDIYALLKQKNMDLFSEEDFAAYSRVRSKIQSAIASEFGMKEDSIYLTHPTFFSRMTDKKAITQHDEYWHVHVDKTTYGSFDYTSLLYLSDYGQDFSGGRFIFVDSKGNSTVEPKFGRLSFFTSGSENTHHVEKVTSGIRYAITVSFTCNPAKAIKDPSFAGVSSRS